VCVALLCDRGPEAADEAEGMAKRTTTRHSEAEGEYEPNHFLLRLAKETELVPSARGLAATDSPAFPTFFHEYWHYWWSVSTLVGFKNYAFVHDLLAHFSQTLMASGDGRSNGAASLSAKQRADATASLRRTAMRSTRHHQSHMSLSTWFQESNSAVGRATIFLPGWRPLRC
jgi:hypothetical protein